MPRFVVVSMDEALQAHVGWQDGPVPEGALTVSEDQVFTILGRLFERATEVDAVIAEVAAGMRLMLHLAGGWHNPLVAEAYSGAESGLVRLDSLIHYNTK
jgi:hypothetical protein